MEIKHLKGFDIEKDKEYIFENIKKEDVVFVLDNQMHLYNYIDKLELGDANLFRLKICKEINGIDVDYKKNGETTHFHKLSDLLVSLDLSCETYVTVKGDLTNDEARRAAVRTQLSDIMQQFIYLNIPLEQVQIMTEQEHKNIERVKKFEADISKHGRNIVESKQMLSGQEFGEYTDIKEQVMASLQKIEDALLEAESNELKIAVAASKKSGKSVIVNSMIECELAPTSLELATPNNCIYKCSEDGYVLKYADVEKRFDSASKLKEEVRVQFKNAEMNKEAGYAIPDMEIGYMPIRHGLSSYTIYDTPGPDLAGATGHKDAAKRAINEADVIIFTIDYSKYLQESEFDYLRYIRELFGGQQKYYSLIININKLDLQYDTAGDKSSVRIMDFIRNKLINIAQEFRDCIVVGTSALTYFNCIEMVKIPKCECLEKSLNFRDDLDDCIDEYIGTEEMTVLNFVSKMVRNMRNFHGEKISSISQLKMISGMPNLLNYVEYIARNKARTERVNNLIHHIENEYVAIQNQFRFQELEEELAKNQDKLARAKDILSKFTDDVKFIYDKNYTDVCQLVKDKKAKSTIIKKLGKKSPFEPKEIGKEFVENYIEPSLEPSNIIDHIINEVIPSRLSAELRELFQSSERKIDKKTVVTEDAIGECFVKAVEPLGRDVSGYIKKQFNDLWNEFVTEYENVQEDLKDILNSRIGKLQEAINNCKEQLDEECSILFNLETPFFDFAFPGIGPQSGRLKIRIDNEDLSDEILRRINKVRDNKMNKEGGKKKLKDFQNIFLCKAYDFIRSHSKDGINRMCYDIKYIMDEIYDKEIKYHIKTQIEKAEIDRVYEKDKLVLIKKVCGFWGYLKGEMTSQRKGALSLAQKVKEAVDHTSDIEKCIHDLENKNHYLQLVRECVENFCTFWNEEMRNNI